jgi:hypothetical protein
MEVNTFYQENLLSLEKLSISKMLYRKTYYPKGYEKRKGLSSLLPFLG